VRGWIGGGGLIGVGLKQFGRCSCVAEPVESKHPLPLAGVHAASRCPPGLSFIHWLGDWSADSLSAHNLSRRLPPNGSAGLGCLAPAASGFADLGSSVTRSAPESKTKVSWQCLESSLQELPISAGIPRLEYREPPTIRIRGFRS
jgi:hypothetical protein